MSVWLIATGIALFIEGLFLGVSPQAWRKFIQEVQKLPDNALQKIGMALCIGGLLLMLLGQL